LSADDSKATAPSSATDAYWPTVVKKPTSGSASCPLVETLARSVVASVRSRTKTSSPWFGLPAFPSPATRLSADE
jgi:hypothetical protein